MALGMVPVDLRAARRRPASTGQHLHPDLAGRFRSSRSGGPMGPAPIHCCSDLGASHSHADRPQEPVDVAAQKSSAGKVTQLHDHRSRCSEFDPFDQYNIEEDKKPSPARSLTTSKMSSTSSTDDDRHPTPTTPRSCRGPGQTVADLRTTATPACSVRRAEHRPGRGPRPATRHCCMSRSSNHRRYGRAFLPLRRDSSTRIAPNRLRSSSSTTPTTRSNEPIQTSRTHSATHQHTSSRDLERPRRPQPASYGSVSPTDAGLAALEQALPERRFKNLAVRIGFISLADEHQT